jgi:hypothetical protein
MTSSAAAGGRVRRNSPFGQVALIATDVVADHYRRRRHRLWFSGGLRSGSWCTACAVALLAAAMALASAPAARAAGVTFAPAVSYPSGNAPESVAVGDFNGDGDPDLAVAAAASGGVIVRLGDGRGGFGAATESVVGEGPASVVVGEFNGDGNPDLAVANEDSNTVSVLLGEGNGAFAPAVTYPVGELPSSVAVGEFNGDGNPDLAVAIGGADSVLVLLGEGSGGFDPAGSYNVGSGPASVAVGDFNGDGTGDLAVANDGSDTVSVLLGDGSGGFGQATEFPLLTITAAAPVSVAVGDFNGDGNADLAVANAHSNDVSVLLGDGQGGFGPATNFPVLTSLTSRPAAVAVGDFDGDGNPDLAVADNNVGLVSVLLGDGRGGFGPANSFLVGERPFSVAAGDFNRDGNPDLAVVNDGSFDLSVLINRTPVGAATLDPATRDFGTQAQGTFSPAAPFTLTAGSGARVHVTGATIVGANADAFVIASDACVGQTLRAGQTCAVGVRFAPGEQGARSAALQIADDAPNAPQTVRLSGTGGGPPGGETGAAGPAGPPGPSGSTVTPARAARPFTGRAARRRPGSVTMRGTIDTMGETVTWQFEYGRHRPYENATPVRTITAGDGRRRVSWRLRHLPPNATFHYRLVARVSPGADQAPLVGRGRDRRFTTCPMGSAGPGLLASSVRGTSGCGQKSPAKG